MNSLVVKDLKKSFPHSEFQLKEVSFAIPKGTIMGFIGENGSGKSTTIGCILHTLNKEAGSIEVLGQEMTDDSIGIRDQIGVVYDTSSFPVELSPLKIGTAMKHIYSKWDNQLYQEYLKKFRLPKKQIVKEFSRGMTMKLNLAVALSHKPKLLVLDEATSGLDPIVRDEILDILLEFVQDEENSVFISSHITSDLEKIADYITFIHDGEIIFSDQKDILIYNYGIMRCKAAQFALVDKEDMVSYRKHDLSVDVLVKDRQATSKKYKDAIIDSVSIEEIMLMLVKGEKVS